LVLVNAGTTAAWEVGLSGLLMHLLEDLDLLLDNGALKVTSPSQSAYTTKLSQQPLAETAASVGGTVQKHTHCPTPLANPQVLLLTLKSHPAQAQAQAPKSA
jgi:hypothetical protein